MKSLEQRLLAPTDHILEKAATAIFPQVERANARLAVLEAVSSAVGGWDLADYQRLSLQDHPPAPIDAALWTEKLLASIDDTGIPIALALSALSREVISHSQQRKTGAYYTDWRLAEMLAASSVPDVTAEGPWIDPACGTGTLLAAAVMQIPAGPLRDHVIRNRLCGADLSPNALRGALLSVASLTGDLSAIQGFVGRLLLQDSLRSSDTWARIAPSGAALVIGNPPWEKLRISRHEAAKAAGATRSYGESFDGELDLTQHRSALLNYIEKVATGTRLQGRGEHDLYKLFLELGLGIAAHDGVLALLLPAGLIRSKGTESLRRELTSLARELSISVIENRASHFAIDTRFKFLSIVAKIGDGRKRPIYLKVADRTGKLPDTAVEMSHAQLTEVRPDLSIPEVRTPEEWELYLRLASTADRVGDPAGPWAPTYLREVDMTSDRWSFHRYPSDEMLPLIEGRHVSQFRWRAKRYFGGEGRSAIWKPEPLSRTTLQTQWHVPRDALKESSRQSAGKSRIGFRDITGQTNERSLLAARVPEGVVCGNKVPTLSFGPSNDDKEDLFLALANSLVVDWMLRRIVTTTVNFFLLDTLPLPRIDEASETGRELISLARHVTQAEGDSSLEAWEVGQWRARADAHVAAAWGMNLADMETVLRDFPLLDRGQPAILGENYSTITADSVLAQMAKLLGVKHPSTDRVRLARAAGATPYVPAEYASGGPK